MNSRTPGAAVGAFFSAVARFVAAFAGALLMVGALFVGLLLGLTLMLFALLRGRRPQGLHWRVWPGRTRPGPGTPGAARGEVVDVEAREVVAPERRES